MEAAYGTRPADLIAGIGPSLGPCCAQFIHYRQEFPESFWKYQIRPDYLDLWQLSRDQLTAAGVLEDHIQIAGVCTSCRTDLFFSYRKEKTTGRFATIIALKDDLQA
jgi:polyphenol oxidase